MRKIRLLVLLLIFYAWIRMHLGMELNCRLIFQRNISFSLLLELNVELTFDNAMAVRQRPG